MVVFTIVCNTSGTDADLLRVVTLVASALTVGAVFHLNRRREASPVHKATTGFIIFAGIAVWLQPDGAGRIVVQHPTSCLYAVLLAMAAGPAILGREVFTIYFARKTTPEDVWQTNEFLTINQDMTWFWAGIFTVSMLSGLIPGLFDFRNGIRKVLFEVLIPVATMLGVGVPINKRYPDYYLRKHGLSPLEKEGPPDEKEGPSSLEELAPVSPRSSTKKEKKEDWTMPEKRTIVAVNGSPHAGIGNTSMMVEMLRQPLSEQGFDLEQIYLSDYEIEYCTGCAFCMEKGRCWIDDDHKGIMERILSAEGVIMASPVYFTNVTAQMKTFLDRSLAFGHKPRPTWKPGLAVSVSAGMGETETARYLASSLRVYGAFSIGALTAIGIGPGQFVGKEAVEARAHDLAWDLGRAIKEKRRFPATDLDLRFYHFMSSLVGSHKDTVMRDDHKHWQEHCLYDGFEAYIQQTTTETPYNKEAREAWIKELIASHKEKKRGRRVDAVNVKEPGAPELKPAQSCRELLRTMPHGFNPSAAKGLTATYQFEVSGAEDFIAHLRIADGACTYVDGPADRPDVVIRTPADIWLVVAGGELDGQQAFMSGKYTVVGDMGLLFKLKALFSR
jgi:multimeric flavodoxin WrbA/putative sterol carrier protein